MLMDIIFTNRLNQTDIDVIECGTQKCEPSHSFGPAMRDFYLIHIIHKGCGYFRIENKEFYLKAGDAFAIWPDNLIYYRADSEDPWEYSWVGFHGTKAEFYLRQTNFSLEKPIVACTSYKYVKHCFEEMMLSRALNRSREIHLLGTFYHLLSHFIEEASNDSDFKPIDGRRSQYINKAVEFIKINYSKKISISDIARHVGIDSKYLCTLFKTQLKLSPYKFLLNIRMDRACELLQNTYVTIGDISRSVGYEDQLLFSKMFKRFKGSSPKEFRESYIQH